MGGMTKRHHEAVAEYRRAVFAYLGAPSELAKRRAGEEVTRLRTVREFYVARWRCPRRCRRILRDLRAQCVLLVVAVTVTAWGVDLRSPVRRRGWSYYDYRTLEILPVVVLIALGVSFPISGVVSVWRGRKTTWAQVFAALLILFLVILLLALLRSRPR